MLKIKNIGLKIEKSILDFFDFITYNRTIRLCYVVGMFIFLLLCLISITVKSVIIINSVNILGTILLTYTVIIYVCETYANEKYIKELEDKEWLQDEELLIDLAALSHNIWSEDVKYYSSNVKELDRSLVSYSELTEEEKQANISKAKRIIEVINSYV